MTKTFIAALVAVMSIIWPTASSASSGCFFDQYVAQWAEKYEIEEADAEEFIIQGGMEPVLEELYSRYMQRALKLEDALMAYELFVIDWDIEAVNVEGSELVKLALYPCVKWMWGDYE